eukprot:CAMPEP_0119470446 /NCGR_PEP_ID=MMETSP1344-20130328/3346_1 /TAXON_ID=236787 /ORGANISM="Florenciella parvula, Strain CCMP2471" /LENGTH=64 /DNA_ID=CAMNT_0007503127 /DNA_START=260 /DNA_END=454 /DNA_ORIENTATION=-
MLAAGYSAAAPSISIPSSPSSPPPSTAARTGATCAASGFSLTTMSSSRGAKMSLPSSSLIWYGA